MVAPVGGGHRRQKKQVLDEAREEEGEHRLSKDSSYEDSGWNVGNLLTGCHTNLGED